MHIHNGPAIYILDFDEFESSSKVGHAQDFPVQQEPSWKLKSKDILYQDCLQINLLMWIKEEKEERNDPVYVHVILG